ncbi:uncharacterized protein N7515_007089 [Penicillium bovifimosum]|uniref:Inner kinetochore subunit AME1 domain-containing protein n=1 Tax=Penicillium bovifimosum TaxID=126998 RepID=A0A9W9GVY1_9EURO|nr:uncharacterized protein N7515_007089 [Penicillium bovifimosum]KAJ5131050.1 hypothetical protein N7515_007089 [Penicillium bovifimosum]
MEPTREERQQMRQRGAATRKAKEVNFGFSFGSPIPQPAAPTQLAAPDAQNHPQTQPAPNTTPRHAKQSRPDSQSQETVHTPGSARNKLPPRRSTYDVPSSDDRPEQTRSNKRRKIGPTGETEDSPSRRGGRRTENDESQAAHNNTGSGQSQINHAPDPSSAEAPTPTGPSNGTPQPDTSAVLEPPIENQHAAEEEATGVEPATSAGEEQLAQVASSVPSPVGAIATGEQQGSNPVQAEGVHPSPLRPGERTEIQSTEDAVTKLTPPIAQPDTTTTKFPSERVSTGEAVKARDAPASRDDGVINEEVPQAKDNVPEQGGQASRIPTLKLKKPPRAAPKSTASKTPELPVEDAVQVPATETRAESGAAPVEAIETENVLPGPIQDVAESALGPGRGRKPASQKADEQPQRGRPEERVKQAVEPEPEPATAAQAEPEVEAAAPKSQRGRPSKKTKRAAEAEPELEPESVIAEQPEPEAEPAAQVPQSRGRPGKKTKHAVEPVPDHETENQPETAAKSKAQHVKPNKKATRAVDLEPETELAVENQPRPAVDSAPSKPKRGRPGKKAKRATEPEPEPEPEVVAEQEPEYQPEAEPTQDQPRRKTRQPRGETVPITVYRLANANSLGGTAPTDDRSADEEESSDELTTHQRTKMPNRGGVNPADVLSQICRETLEKTLNTLKDGIANEANATRRAEWSRKRKAVEAFGSELESRLMDLSGMLDSNFVLGMQLKKTKREMMDLRNHLYRVRRERENIALQMDAVRSRHMEEERAGSSRNTINNSLHSLELALERNQQSSTGDSATDLEFMLRSVADVSSTAPGSQGGLLNQIRAFNAQLEATAARLER